MAISIDAAHFLKFCKRSDEFGTLCFSELAGVTDKDADSCVHLLFIDAGVRLAASASSFWLIPRSLSRAASLFPVSFAIPYSFLDVCGKTTEYR